MPYQANEDVTAGEIIELVHGINDTFAKFRAHNDERIEHLEKANDDLLLKLEAAHLGIGQGASRHASNLYATIAKDEAFGAFRDGRTRNALVPLGVGIADLRAAVDNTTYLNPPHFDPRIAGAGSRVSNLRDLLPTITVESGSFQYNQVTGAYANAAAGQGAEGAAKAVQAIPTALQTAAIETVAVLTSVSEQVLADTDALQQNLGNLLRNGVLEKLESELVAGAGGTNLIKGMGPSGVAFAATAGATNEDALSEAAMHLRSQGWQPGGIVVSPAAWHGLRTSKGDDGHYLAGDYGTPVTPSVWNLPVVVSPAIADNTALVFDPAQLALLDRQQVRIDLGRNADDFSKNLLTLRVELRAGLAVFAPGAIAVVTLS